MRLPTIHRNTAHWLLMAAILPAVAAALGASPPPPAPQHHDAPPPTNPADVAADAALADRFEALAELSFPAKVPTGPDRPYVFAQQAALLNASATLDPIEARYPRKVAEAMDGAGDLNGELMALGAAIRAKPDDEFSWIRSLDLHVQAKETASDQLKYLSGLERHPTGIPPNVLAHVLFRMAQIQFDQGRETEARNSLKKALVQNPLSGETLRLRYRLLPANTTAYERDEALLDLLRSNPMQPAYARDLARLTADAGLVQDSLPFFALGVNTSFAQRRPDLEAGLDWAAELYIADQHVDAYNLCSTLLRLSPDYAAAWDLDLLIARSSGFTQAQQDKDLQRATNVLSNRVVQALNAALDLAAAGPTTQPGGGGTAARATTRPIESEGAYTLPDLGPAVAALKAADATTQPAEPPAPGAGRPTAQQVRDEFIAAAADLARLDIYFARKPDAAAPLLDALRALLPANDPLLAQLQGWQSLVAGNNNNAQATLAGVAATDPLAQLGLVQLMINNGANPQEAEAAGRKLLQDHPDRLIGAMLIEGLSSQRVRLIPKAGSEHLQQLLNTFPKDLFALGAAPNQLYSIHVEPVDAGRAYGQPLLTKITLFNRGSADLTVGNDGAIRPGLLFQVTPLIGQQPVAFPAFDTLAGPVVLRARDQLQQTVRLDQSTLLALLDRTIHVAFQVDGQASTNVGAGGGGYTSRFTEPFARTAVNVDVVVQAKKALDDGTPRERITALGELQAYVRELRGVRNLDPNLARITSELGTVIHRARGDATPAVAAWATQADFALSPRGDRPGIVRDLAADPDWRHRQLALLLVPAIPDPDLGRQVVKQLLPDPQASVGDYAKADQALLDMGAPLTPVGAAGSAATPGVRPAAPASPGDQPTPAPMP